ncbi:MAG: class I SAM-dependent methyltransferase [Gammaproteobacteria bacterium]|nr:class I SAM-dependent methyltransferase [Gammaproteobacteria bacterium]
MNQEFFYIMQRLGIHPHPDRYKYYFKQFFHGYNFEGKRVLDIGGGSGVLSFFAAANGAKDVVCLEPEDAGSTSGASKVFTQIKSAGGYLQASILPITFQEYVNGDVGKFDLIVSNASINHLNEDAVVDLQTNPESLALYCDIVQQLREVLTPGGALIIADATRRNFFGDLGLKSPVCTTIEWHKHQNPAFWIKLFRDCGFALVRKEYQTFNVLGDWGKLILGNAIFSYFYGSLFILEFKISA